MDKKIMILTTLLRNRGACSDSHYKVNLLVDFIQSIDFGGGTCTLLTTDQRRPSEALYVAHRNFLQYKAFTCKFLVNNGV